MMRLRMRILFTSVAVLGLCIAAGAQENVPAPEKHALWRVSSKESALYVLGSIHLLKKENYPLPAAINRAFEESDAAVFETDLGESETAGTQRLIMGKAFLPEGGSLKALLSEETYDLLRKKSEAMGVKVLAFDRFKPWYVAIMLSQERMISLGFEPQYGLDRHYHARAVEAGKKVIGLETSRFQLELFNGLSEANQDKLLVQVLRDLEVIEKELDVMVKAWATGDLKALDETILRSFLEHPEIYEKFLTARNRNWLPKIEKLLEDKTKCFVVVGAAHVVGKDSLIDLLVKKGYTVEQL